MVFCRLCCCCCCWCRCCFVVVVVFVLVLSGWQRQRHTKCERSIWIYNDFALRFQRELNQIESNWIEMNWRQRTVCFTHTLTNTLHTEKYNRLLACVYVSRALTLSLSSVWLQVLFYSTPHTRERETKENKRKQTSAGRQAGTRTGTDNFTRMANFALGICDTTRCDAMRCDWLYNLFVDFV